MRWLMLAALLAAPAFAHDGVVHGSDEEAAAHKKALKRHMKLQDKSTRKRMKQTRKKNKKNNRPKKWSAKKRKE